MIWFAEFDPVTTSFVTGRLRRRFAFIAGSAPPIELWIDDVFERSETPGSADPEPVEFRIPLPTLCFDAQEHNIEVHCLNKVHSQPFLSRYEGYIDPFSHNLITGWVTDRSRPGVPVDIDLEVNGTPVVRTTANVFREDLKAHCGLRHLLQETPETDRSFVLRARIAGTDLDLQGSPVLSVARPRLVRAAQQLKTAFHYLEQQTVWKDRFNGQWSAEERKIFADLLLENIDAADIIELQRRFLRPIQGQLTEQYARRDYGTLGRDYPHSVPRRTRGAHLDRPVDIIVPIHSGLAETERCLDSVLQSPAGCRYELVCVLDNPAAAKLNAAVRRFASKHKRMIVLENASRLGFAGSVNRGMMLHRDRDVVILQADCEVHGDWLSRLQSAAYRGEGAGMVNPMTNHAEYLSYPAKGFDLPEDAPFERLDDLAKAANQGPALTLPGAMGFCLYIRRGCLDDVGFFHDDPSGSGYYAEKYFSINAAAQGWRTALATNVFVRHHGYVSLSAQDEDAIQRARQQFEQWCPFYGDAVTDFLVDDPSFYARRELDLARLELWHAKTFCLIGHGGGGGTERHIKDLADALAKQGIHTLILFALANGEVTLTSSTLNGIENLRYRLPDEFEILVKDLTRIGVRHLHYHSNVEMPQSLFALPDRMQVPFDITVHDYAWFCPRVNLVNHSGQYCGEPPVSICETCTDQSVHQLRANSQDFLTRARRVFCPSQDVHDRMKRQFQLQNLQVRPHPERIEPSARTNNFAACNVVRVAAIGRISGHKGLRVLRDCAAHAQEQSLPLQFVVIGSTSDDGQFAELTNVEITGAYQEQEIDQLIEQQRVRVALLPSVWPETYSYTLSIALRCSLTPVAFDLGAIAERVRRAGTGILLPLGTGPAEINQALLLAGQPRAHVPNPAGTNYRNMLRDYYDLV